MAVTEFVRFCLFRRLQLKHDFLLLFVFCVYSYSFMLMYVCIWTFHCLLSIDFFLLHKDRHEQGVLDTSSVVATRLFTMSFCVW
jgi:hypothetical protein